MPSPKKNVPWAGWSKQKPNYRQRTLMKKKCGTRCFLGANKSFPICNKGTCKVNSKGIWAAYVRAREFGSPNKIKQSRKHGKNYYNRIASTAKRLLIKTTRRTRRK